MAAFLRMTLLALSILLSPAHYAASVDQDIHRVDELEFRAMHGGPVEIAVLEGNPQEGQSAVMMRFPPNFVADLHYHTYDYHSVVVRGATKHWVEGESEAEAVLLEEGDYFFQKGGQLHGDSFPTDEPTILFLRFEGPIDTFMSGKH